MAEYLDRGIYLAPLDTVAYIHNEAYPKT